MYLRPYKKTDSETILSWCRDEKTFRFWTSDRYDHFPITEDDMNYKYFDCNGDCIEEDNFYPMTACDDDGIVGHFILRYTNGDVHTLRIGFVIIDDKKRGCGVGREMISLALRYAFTIAGAEKVTIGVFENNTSAYHCYKSAGFKEISIENPQICNLFGEKIKVVELSADKKSFYHTTELPVPTHLKNNFIPIGTDNTEYKVTGRIFCNCGNTSFEVWESNDREIDKLICSNCGKDMLLFDSGKHGWNGFVCKMDFLDRTKLFNKYSCGKCSCDHFEVTSDISSQGKQDFTDECVSNDNSFKPDDWVDGFEWITISLSCCNCRSIEKDWLDLETM